MTKIDTLKSQIFQLKKYINLQYGKSFIAGKAIPNINILVDKRKQLKIELRNEYIRIERENKLKRILNN